MQKPVRPSRFPKDVQFQGLLLLIAVVFAYLYPAQQPEAVLSSLGSVMTPKAAVTTRTVPLLSRSRRFQIAIDTLAEGAASKRSPEVVAYYQELQARIKHGTVTVNTSLPTGLGAVQGGRRRLIEGNLPFKMNPAIQSWVTYFTKSERGRATMRIALGRAGRYLPMAQAIFAREGLPTDLVFLAQAESTWLPKIDSHAAARGIWQFIPETGEHYGLTQTQWVDERSNPERSTVAAALYLRDLYHLFNDWPLAMAAYNSGENRVARSIVTNGRPDFWELYERDLLPDETRNYVPIILAIITVAKDYEAYGFDVNFEPALDYETVRVSGAVNLQLLADCAGTTLEEIQALNPQFKSQATAPAGTQMVYVPGGAAARTLALLEEVPAEKRLAWRVREARPGDDLAEIAAAYDVSVDELRAANSLAEGALSTVTTLVIPTKARPVVIPERPARTMVARAAKAGKSRTAVAVARRAKAGKAKTVVARRQRAQMKTANVVKRAGRRPATTGRRR